MPRQFWTQARIAELKRLWRAGVTAAAIGTALGGITRAAVLGKIFRLRLAMAAPGASAIRDDTPARRRAGKPLPQPEPKARRKTLLDLTNECCRWPYGELGEGRFFFCGDVGADVARGIPYCPRHMRRAYIVPPSLVKPLHNLIARSGKRLSVRDDSASRSFPRKRESSGPNSVISRSSGFPLSAFTLRVSADSKPAAARKASVGGSGERAVINKRKFG
jgi:GcrA cell cycle regulator